MFEPVLIKNIFSEERFNFFQKEIYKMVDSIKLDPEFRTLIDARETNTPLLHVIGQEALPIAKKAFNNPNLYSVKNTFVHYLGPRAELGKHKDSGIEGRPLKSIYLLDICFYQKIPWGVFVEGKEYIFNENCGVAFDSGLSEHWRGPNPDPVNNPTGVVLCYFEEFVI